MVAILGHDRPAELGFPDRMNGGIVEITCPPVGANILVTGQGSGPGGTICVHGSVGDQDPDRVGLPLIVRVCVVAGWVKPPPPSADSPPPGWVDVTPTGSDWFAAGVGVPAYSPTGVPCTVIVWSKLGANQWSAPTAVQFIAGGPDAIDCCNINYGVTSTASPAAFASWPPPPPPLPPNLGSGSN